MKLKKLGLFLIMASVAVFSACSDDDDKNKTDLALESQGNYKGQLVVTQDGEKDELANMARFITLTKSGHNVVKIDLKQLEIKGLLTATDIALNNVKLEGETGNVTIKDTQKVTLPALNNMEADVTTDGTIIGKKIDLELIIDASGLKIKVSFKGEFTEESEDLTDYAAEVASNYKGLLTKVEGSNTEKKDGEVIAIEKAKTGMNNEIKLMLKDLTLGNKFWGEIVVDEMYVFKLKCTTST